MNECDACELAASVTERDSCFFAVLAASVISHSAGCWMDQRPKEREHQIAEGMVSQFIEGGANVGGWRRGSVSSFVEILFLSTLCMEISSLRRMKWMTAAVGKT